MATAIDKTGHQARSFPASLGVLQALAWSALLAPVTLGQAPHLTLTGTQGDHLGSAVSGAGDVNADGYDDLAVGSPQNRLNAPSAGNVRVFSGLDGSLLLDLYGTSFDGRLGTSVACAGDVNGDGHADIVVGAPGEDVNGNDTGSVYVFSGRDGSQLYHFVGAAPTDQLGRSVSGAGDVNGDGYDDVLAGGPGGGFGSSGGMARVFSGRDGALLLTLTSGSSTYMAFGYAVGGGGDMSGDGQADLLVGANLADNAGTDSGSVYVFSGATGALLRRVDGPSSGSWFGRSVSRVGDVNGDGRDDFVVGAPRYSQPGPRRGMARLHSGADGSVLFTWLGTIDGQDLGDAVGGAGDVDADGYPDVIAGAPNDRQSGTDAGMAVVYSGRDGSVLHQLLGFAPYRNFGFAVAGAGDGNGDGFAEVIVGEPNNTGTGLAYVYRLRQPVVAGVWRTFYGTAQNDVFGASVDGAGDTNGDGIPDIVVGATGDPMSSVAQGYVRILSGADGSTLHTFFGNTLGDRFGHAVAGAGDIDADGYGDVIVSAYSPNGLGYARVHSGRNGWVLGTLRPGIGMDEGWAVDGVGDVDLDGHTDLIVGAPDFSLASSGGVVEVYSGRTGTVLARHSSSVPNAALGFSVCGIGDVDGDGVSDYAIGAPIEDTANGTEAGRVYVYSGATHAPLYVFQGDTAQDWLGWAVDGVGDVDGDGRPEIAAVAHGGQTPSASRTFVRVYSGATGAVLYTLRGFDAAKGIGDLDRDGSADLFVRPVGPPGAGNWRWLVLSGRDRSLLAAIDPEPADVLFGATAAGMGDRNGDGSPDLVIGAIGTNGTGAARVYHSLTARKTKFRISGPACPGSNGRLPRVGHTGRAALGQSFDATLRAAPTSSATFLVIGLVPQLLDLTPLGMPGCVALTQPLTTIFQLTSATGTARFQQPVPNSPALLGLPVYFQWFCLDLAANSRGVISSNVLLATVGNP